MVTKILLDSTVNLSDIIVRESSDVVETVRKILIDVKENGDKALIKYTEKFDGIRMTNFKVSQTEIKLAVKRVDPYFMETLKIAKQNITKFHKKQKKKGFEINDADGNISGQIVLPLEKVGIYVPGGTASYPSSVLMNAIPAKIAGVKEIIMVTPTKTGIVADEILAAAYVAGITKIFKIGGAQSVGALAYGTKSVPKVDKIVGPGNVFVAEAKRQVFGEVDIDMIAGPSEILIVADEYARAELVAADMLSQAEHDKNASAVLITDSAMLADKVSEELEKQIPLLLRSEIAKVSIETWGKIIIVKDIDEAVSLSNEIAPEHLELCVKNPFELLKKVKNAGSVFLGYNTPEAIGDYIAGTNHTLPTSGTAKFFSPLSVDDFIKKVQYICYSEKGLQNTGARVIDFANREGLTAHGISVEKRMKK